MPQSVDLTAKPFHLDAGAVAWVRSTIEAMTVEEKIGQLFVNLNRSFAPAYLDEVLDRYHVGGIRYTGAPAAAVQDHVRYAQSRSKIPLLVASNPEMGGFGSADDGTLVSTHLQAGSHPDPSIAYEMGRVAGVETAAMGCNWAFAPVVDIHYNWRNTVVSTRSFGNTPEVVIERATEYFRGITESKTVCAVKHFPGDGVDERDQHVVTTYNTLPAADWDASFGRVYREMIALGVQSIMVGHIGAPHLSRRYRPDLTDDQILPGSLAPELLQDLLRGELNFNGLVVTDASSMIGMTSAMRRRDLVPAAIAAGCDMFLFFRDPAEDFGFMLDGYRNGVITEERLQEALERILGLKASLGLHTTPPDELVPAPSALAVIGCGEHHTVAAAIADKTATLVKDTQHNLPLTPATHPRIRLYGISGHSDFTGTDPNGYLDIARDELERAGFAVDTVGTDSPVGYADRYDAAIVFANVAGFAQEATIRIRWSAPMGPEIPWYVTEVPTVFVSLNQPNHLIDVPMVKTLVHAHNPSREAIHAAVEKIQGLSEFRGTYNENVFCNTFGTRS